MIDMRGPVWLALVMAACLALLGQAETAGAEQPVDLELVLAVDVSGSVDVEEAELQRQGYVSALSDDRVMEAIKSGIIGSIAVAFVEWADPYTRTKLAEWTHIYDADSARAFARALDAAPRTHGRYTSISGAIDFAMPLFSDNGFEGTRRVIDVSGDGPNNTGGLVTGPRDRAIEAGFAINGLPIVNDRPGPWGRPPMRDLYLYYQNCVIGGPRAFIVVAKGFESFAIAIRRKLLIEIAGLDPAAVIRPAAFLTGGATPWTGMLSRLGLVWSKRRTPWTLPIQAAEERVAPPCDEGERLLQMRRRRFIEEW